MRVATFAGLSLLLWLTGCDQYVERSKYEESQRELQKVRAELNEAKQQLQEASAQKFSTYQNGGRTWRFNSTTGETCILLTSEWDWKKKETQSQSCDCKDSLRSHTEALRNAKTAEEKRAELELWTTYSKMFCGY